ncbi:MAG: hypothetical protein HQM14_21465 [SAR324 cluster bacterium]|nr:hypothetical protein [SAR324 cluster bacterium]
MKSLCDMKKKKAEALIKSVSHPKFICGKCGRLIDKKKYLCKPKKIDE